LKKDYAVYLEDMINAIEEIEKSTSNVTFEDFASHYEKINSVAYDVLIIGEAVDKIPKSVQDKNPQFLGVTKRHKKKTYSRILHRETR
jgi:uncharacterized protein with HEPN domain